MLTGNARRDFLLLLDALRLFKKPLAPVNIYCTCDPPMPIEFDELGNKVCSYCRKRLKC
jgi:hypothetical protein